jgi:biopolymer transport protein ExbB/TolQ
MKNRTAVVLLSTVVLAIVGAWFLVMIVGGPFAADPLHKGTTPAEGVTQAFAASIRPIAAHIVNWIYCFIILLLGYCLVLGLVIFPRNMKRSYASLANWKDVFENSWKEIFGSAHRRVRENFEEGGGVVDSPERTDLENPRAQVQHFVDAILDKYDRNSQQSQDFALVITDSLKRFNPDEGPDILYHNLISEKEELNETLEDDLAPIEVGLHLSPLLGFLGTVVSLVKLFYNVSISAEGMNQQAVAQDLQEALITTIFGLVSAFLIHLIRLYAHSKLVSYMDELREASQRVVEMVQNAIQSADEAVAQLTQKIA